MSHRVHTTHGDHGLTCEEFDALLDRADGQCEVCSIQEASAALGRLCIDHDHRRGTGRDHIRGLVCAKCNADLKSVDRGTKVPTSDQARYLANAWFWEHHPSPEAPVEDTVSLGPEISVREARSNLARLIQEVRGGVTVHVTHHGRRTGVAFCPSEIDGGATQ